MKKDLYRESDQLANYIGEHQNENPDFMAVHLYADIKKDKCGGMIVGKTDELESLIFGTMAKSADFAYVVINAVERFAKIAKNVISEEYENEES